MYFFMVPCIVKSNLINAINPVNLITTIFEFLNSYPTFAALKVPGLSPGLKGNMV